MFRSPVMQLSGFNVLTDTCHHHQLTLEHFHHLKKKPCAIYLLSSYPSFPYTPSSKHSLIYFRSPLLWTFHINGIKQYAVFCDWLLLPSIIFLRFIHVKNLPSKAGDVGSVPGPG